MNIIKRNWQKFEKTLADIQQSESRYLNKSILLKESPNPLLYKLLIRIIGFLVVSFLLWSSFMEISEVATAQGEIVPSSKVQNIQHPNGGVVKEIFVNDGEFVTKGQILMELDPVSSASILGQSNVQMENFQLQKKRLETFIKYTTISTENMKLKRASSSNKTSVIELLKSLEKCGADIPLEGAKATIGTIKTNRSGRINIRKGAGTNYTVVGKVYAGAHVLIIGSKKGWVQVYESHCNKAWAHSSLLDIKKIIMPQTTTSPLPTAPDFSNIQVTNPMFVEEHTRIYNQQIKSYHSNQQVIEHQKKQLRQELNGRYETIRTLKAQNALWSKEYKIKRKLYKQGIFSKVELIQIERKVSEIKGDLSQIQPKINRVNEEIAEIDGKLEQYSADLIKLNSTELAEVNNRIGQLAEILKRDRQEFQQLSIKSPLDGIVHGLRNHTLGGVIKPSETIMYVVPNDHKLVADVRINSLDIGHLIVGQGAVLKLTTFTFDKYGGIKGILTEVSPSTYKDENGEPYYSATISLERNYVGNDPTQHKIMPGMTVQADIKTGGKTLLQYLISPIQKAASEGMRER